MITEALLVTEAGAQFSYQEITADDNLRDDEVLVEMKATGVCHTDLNFSKEKTIPGLFPAVFGHEGKSQRADSKVCN
jgi:aryl-alcohol dehydrogenase